MSIINDALKKAVTGKQRPVFSDKISVALETERKKNGVNWGPIFVILVIILITAPIIAPLFSTPFRRSSSQATAISNRQPAPLPMTPQMSLLASASDLSGSRKGQFLVEEFPLKSMAPLSMAAPNWLLTGIVFAPDGSYAIINDKVARIGDDVQGAKLEKINSNDVVLDYKGQKIELQGSR